MAEGARLLSEYGGNTPSRVRISLSPPHTSVSRVDTIHGVSPFFVWWCQKYLKPYYTTYSHRQKNPVDSSKNIESDGFFYIWRVPRGYVSSKTQLSERLSGLTTLFRMALFPLDNFPQQLSNTLIQTFAFGCRFYSYFGVKLRWNPQIKFSRILFIRLYPLFTAHVKKDI